MRNAMIIETNKEAVKSVIDAVTEICGMHVHLSVFNDPFTGIKHGVENPPDIVFTEANMKQINGFDVMRILKQNNIRAQFIFLSNEDRWKAEATRLWVLGWVHNPPTQEEIQKIKGRI